MAERDTGKERVRTRRSPLTNHEPQRLECGIGSVLRSHTQCAEKIRWIVTGRGSALVPNKRFRVQAGVCAVFALVASVGLCCTNGPAGATAGPSNNFGSDNTVGDISNAIYLNDGRYVDWSLWWNYIGNWNLQQLSIIINVVEAGTEYYEPTDLHVTRGGQIYAGRHRRSGKRKPERHRNYWLPNRLARTHHLWLASPSCV